MREWRAGVLLIGCSEGGTSIEDLAEKFPEKIVRIPVDIREGITDAQAGLLCRCRRRRRRWLLLSQRR